MNIAEIVLLLVVVILAILGYLVVTHKITVAKIEGLADQLHMVHGAVIAPAPAVAAAPAPAPVVPEAVAAPAVAKPLPPPVATPAPAPAPAPAPERTAGDVLSPMVASMIGGGGGNATPGAPVSNFDARSLISDDTVLTVGGTKFRTPPGRKVFTLPLMAGRGYQLTTADGNAMTHVAVTDAAGNELGKDSNGNGYAQVYFTAKTSGIATVVVDFEGTYPDAGIEVHATAI
jgi:hypothetical protein